MFKSLIMSFPIPNFDNRMRNIIRKHKRLDIGAVRRMGKDGLVTLQPKRRLPAFPIRALFLLALVAVIFKAFLMAQMGVQTYTAELAHLNVGSAAEKVGAWLLQPDAVSSMLASGMTSIFF